MNAKTAARSDHRSRVAAEKRARMRRTLVESALFTFAEKGVDASVIEDVIAAAGVSRGTFYNYFSTNAELLVAANVELMSEIMTLIEARVHEAPTPAARLCLGLRLYLDVARRFPLFARFMTRAGPTGAGLGSVLHDYVPRHIAAAVKLGEFIKLPISVALDVVAGTMLMAVARIASREADDTYLAGALSAILRAQGLDERRVKVLVGAPLRPLALGPDTLCVRSQMLWEARTRDLSSATK